jgi:uroporphyrinogen decarboxylase
MGEANFHASSGLVMDVGIMEDVRREVRERVKLLGTGGGYVFAPIHSIQADILPEKVLAIYDTVSEGGTYPLL